MGILLTYEKHLHEVDCIISLKGDILDHKSSRTLPLLIEVSAPRYMYVRKVSGHVYNIYAKGIEFASFSVSIIFLNCCVNAIIFAFHFRIRREQTLKQKMCSIHSFIIFVISLKGGVLYETDT